MKSALSVWWNDKIAGTLRLDEHGDMTFVYAPDWIADESCVPLSRSLPKQEEPFDRRRTRPFFAGLLPEETQRDSVARALGISRGNDFAFLKALGGDVAGALTLWPEGEAPPAYDGAVAREPLGDNALIALLDALPKRPLLAGEEGLRLSLAGSQSKLPVVLVDGDVALPALGQPTTHILKPPMTRFSATTENEAFAMRLAASIGLSVAPVEVRRVKDRPYLLVERYDRILAAGDVRRLHQEDFCQALGIPPEHKYAAEGGPTFKTGFKLLRDATARPALEVLKLLDAAIFNLIVGNADAHGKNYSLLYGAEGATLAPLYDLMCTAAYPEVSPRLAMKIGDLSTIEDLKRPPWTDFARDTGLGAAFVRRRAGELADAVAAAVSADAFEGADAARGFANIVRARAEVIHTSVKTAL